MLELATIAFNQPRLISEQVRLLRKHLADQFNYTVVDASTDPEARAAIVHVCRQWEVGYREAPHEHVDALNFAWAEVLKPTKSRYLGTLDHDVFPVRSTRLVKLLAPAGFYGIGQRHAPTGHLYLWPGFAFFDRRWLAGRDVDFGGIRNGDKRDDGDTGSAMWELFADESWRNLYRAAHGYEVIREPDGFGLQSWGIERLGDWLHFSNASGWMAIPNPEERRALLFEILENL